MLEFNDYKKNFIQNKYLKWYIRIVQANIHRTKQDKKTTYLEAHHILPKSMGGSDEPTNIVYLPLKAHFVIHHILTKICIGDDLRKMSGAFRCFIYGAGRGRANRVKKCFSSKLYEKIRAVEIEKQRIEMRANIGPKNPMFGKKVPKEKAMEKAAIRRRNGSYCGEKQRQVIAAIPKEQRLKSIEQGKNTYFKNGSNIRESKRMKENNPMYREDVMRRGVETRNIYYNSPSFRYKCVMDLMVKYNYEDANKFVYDFMVMESKIDKMREATVTSQLNFEPFFIEFHPKLVYHNYKTIKNTINKLLNCLDEEV